ncbi:KWG Leptospira [compost metagenome]
MISEQDKYYLIDQQGKKISEAYDFLSNGGENLWLNMRSEKYGFIDAKGKQVIPSKYIYAAPFDAGLSLVSENGEDFFYIDTKGKFVQKMDNE